MRLQLKSCTSRISQKNYFDFKCNYIPKDQVCPSSIMEGTHFEKWEDFSINSQLYIFNFSNPNQFYKNFDFWTESYLKVKNILNMKIMRKPRLQTVYGVMVTENLLKTDKGVFVTIYGYSGEVVRNWSWWLLKVSGTTHHLLRIYQNLPQSP